ncbi:MAG: hypothetical protein Q8M58_11515 [Anaerolineales bacterium]|nr:hypothetical protein [Anaerolineales bacterium]
MSITLEESITVKPTHPWLREIHVAFVPGPMTPLLEEMMEGLERHFRRLGHQVQMTPDDHTDVILTTAPFGEPLHWREALIFSARRRFNLSCTPTVYTLVQVSLTRFQQLLDYFQTVLAKEPPDPADYDFPGLASQAYRVLFEQGRRGGPILALERLVMAQTKSIRVLLVVGDDRSLVAYHLDLVGAHPRSEAEAPESFYEDIVLRMVTTLSTTEVNQHQAVEDPIPRALWQRLSTPVAMCVAGQQLGERNFFTEMVRIADLVEVPAVSDAVASQYSEGCFATWDPTLGALIATVTGSARAVDKGSITEDDLAVIVGVRSDGRGALVRHVEGKRNDPPSVEAVEMMDMNSALPTIVLGPAWNTPARVPVVRSKLHGHRGIAAYDPRRVEYVPLDPPYYHYPVSCGTDAQARGIKGAFARSETLQNPEDSRQVVFTVLPGHGVVIVEKWVPGTAPFQVMWEYMDSGYLEVENLIPQGPMKYIPGSDGRMLLRTA